MAVVVEIERPNVGILTLRIAEKSDVKEGREGR